MEHGNHHAADSSEPAEPGRGSPQTPEAVSGFWDQSYSEKPALWSGRPNAALVSEIRGLQPGRVLDVGCGEGADAVWLAEQSWEVTALEVSTVALDRAARQAARRGVTVTWLHSGLVEAALPPASFDLVSAQYPALLRTGDKAAEFALLHAVAPGGTLLVVHHQLPADPDTSAHSAALRDYVGLADVAALLDENWHLEVHETRPRNVSTGAGAHHTEDVVLRARRLR
ncbi:class I SAM-dependent methyltransferase [Arthrobacter sp. APC 3897]|uniref:class I SAM-dependent methyltransferase n=1 Tax=Arthrobacter sp. APC 3897 TaxID=3035204 RepID=UPI0025B4B06E|nr:class I SAM-dependent methyltransferase [Arthrobacter sp. APC 3897]MDN3481136.1 class I SAM-dependent methyltransferase [Arthrobacter sp. APC 3897]